MKISRIQQYYREVPQAQQVFYFINLIAREEKQGFLKSVYENFYQTYT